MFSYLLSYNKLLIRGVAQLVARTAGGREVAGSSPVTPTIVKTRGFPRVFAWAGILTLNLLCGFAKWVPSQSVHGPIRITWAPNK
jgi:hypothetical protein